MKKSEAAILIVRVLGLISCLNGIRYLINLFQNLIVATPYINSPDIKSAVSGLYLGMIIEIIIWFSLGVYLLRDGHIVFKLLDYEKS